MEISRLSLLNTRTLCITFPYMSNQNIRPSYDTMMSLTTSIQCLVFAKAFNPWCFLVFPSTELKAEAELYLHNKMIGQHRLVVDTTKMMVPVEINNLEDTRDDHCLAVHGLANDTTEDDLRAVFFKAKHVIVVQRGGSAFLNYDRKEECKEDFLSGEYTKVKDVRVVVMFGHNVLLRPAIHEKKCDMIVKSDPCSKKRESWQPMLQFLSKNGDISELLDLLLSSDLVLERMLRQFSRSKGKREEVEKIKIKWLDVLVKRALEKYKLSESEASIYKRGDLRSLVEGIWIHFESMKAELDSIRRVRCRSRSQMSRNYHMTTHSRMEYEYEQEGIDFNHNSNVNKDNNDNSDYRVIVDMDIDISSHEIHEQLNMGPGCNSLSSYLEKKLLGLGLKQDLVTVETEKIMVSVKQVLRYVDKASMVQKDNVLQSLLAKYGYKPGHISDRLAAVLVAEWAGRGRIKAKAEQELLKSVDREKDANYSVDDGIIPSQIMGVEEGYPRMALVMAFFLHTQKGLEEQISKDLARAMVGVWITYGFTYQQMCEVCQGTGRKELKVEMLRRMLNTGRMNDICVMR